MWKWQTLLTSELKWAHFLQFTTCTNPIIHIFYPHPPPPPKKKKKKNLHRHCFRLLLGHFHVPGEIANNGYANALGSNRGVLWDCARSEFYFRFFCLDFIYFNSKEDKLLRIILKINWYERFQSKNIEWKICSCTLTLSVKPQIWLFHVVIEQSTASICDQILSARATRIFFLMIFLFCSVLAHKWVHTIFRLTTKHGLKLLWIKEQWM